MCKPKTEQTALLSSGLVHGELLFMRRLAVGIAHHSATAKCNCGGCRFWLWSARFFLRRVARQPLVRTRPVVITPESRQLLFQVMLVPEKTVVQILSTQSADEAFDKRMGDRRIGHRLNRFDLQ